MNDAIGVGVKGVTCIEGEMRFAENDIFAAYSIYGDIIEPGISERMDIKLYAPIIFKPLIVMLQIEKKQGLEKAIA